MFMLTQRNITCEKYQIDETYFHGGLIISANTPNGIATMRATMVLNPPPIIARGYNDGI